MEYTNKTEKSIARMSTTWDNKRKQGKHQAKKEKTKYRTVLFVR